MYLGKCLDGERLYLFVIGRFQTSTLIEMGGRFAAALARGEVAHNNAEIWIDLEKTIRVVIPRSGTTLVSYFLMKLRNLLLLRKTLD